MKLIFKETYYIGSDIWYIDPQTLRIETGSIRSNEGFHQEVDSVINILLAIFHMHKNEWLNKTTIKRIYYDDCYRYFNIKTKIPTIPNRVSGYSMYKGSYAIPTIFMADSSEEIYERYSNIYDILTWLDIVKNDSVIYDSVIYDWDYFYEYSKSKQLLLLLK